MDHKQRVNHAVYRGIDFKGHDGYGKEWYALYIGSAGNGVLVDWVDEKIKELYPAYYNRVSVIAVIFDLHQICRNYITVAQCNDVQYIHKRRFKRHLKKALQRNQVRL